MAKKKISELVKELTGDFLLENGLELYHCEFVKEGRDWFLRVYIDKHDPDSYVSTDYCEMVSRFLSDRLDEEDPIAQNYYLEVSSPGMDRILYEPETAFQHEPFLYEQYGTNGDYDHPDDLDHLVERFYHL